MSRPDSTDHDGRVREGPAEADRFYRIAENCTHIIWLGTADMSEILYVSRAYEDLWGYPRSALYGDARAYIDHLHPEDRQGEVEALDRMARWAEAGTAPDEFRDEYRVYDADGDLHWVDEIAFPIRDDDGDVVRWAGIVTDITERKRKEQQLQRERERLDEFASVVSHDLRNPLGVIENSVELAQETGDFDHLERCKRACDSMRRLIDDVLTLARDGTMVGERSSTELPPIAADAWAAVDTEDASIRVETDRIVQADPRRLRQLLENLFRNAVDHGGNDVTVRVGELRGGFFVEDDGSGFPPNERGRIFEPGFSTADDGTGFGLSIVRRIAEAHGWRVTADEARDGGARFEIVDPNHRQA